MANFYQCTCSDWLTTKMLTTLIDDYAGIYYKGLDEEKQAIQVSLIATWEW